MDYSVEETLAILSRRAGVRDEEHVDELDHALQTAQQARDHGADPEVVAAALLHDIGRAPEIVERYGPGPHEQLGALFCRTHISERAASLVAAHVPAKRYLVAVDPSYAGDLSPTSVASLARQGGPMSPDEITDFEAAADSELAALLRRWDDGAKSPDARPAPLASYAEDLRAVWAIHDDA